MSARALNGSLALSGFGAEPVLHRSYAEATSTGLNTRRPHGLCPMLEGQTH